MITYLQNCEPWIMLSAMLIITILLSLIPTFVEEDDLHE